ncbi:hypothetical protein [Pandoravirus japonicus]|uniref:Uncharacterized protein n=1 Tax=Pandoravirus japonicus TaxID=2823154 RepID=A0A811BMN9_9VIRU|nr:hypothetical protein [Pandoravirus japonicus]
MRAIWHKKGEKEVFLLMAGDRKGRRGSGLCGCATPKKGLKKRQHDESKRPREKKGRCCRRVCVRHKQTGRLRCHDIGSNRPLFFFKDKKR